MYQRKAYPLTDIERRQGLNGLWKYSAKVETFWKESPTTWAYGWYGVEEILADGVVSESPSVALNL